VWSAEKEKYRVRGIYITGIDRGDCSGSFEPTITWQKRGSFPGTPPLPQPEAVPVISWIIRSDTRD